MPSPVFWPGLGDSFVSKSPYLAEYKNGLEYLTINFFFLFFYCSCLLWLYLVCTYKIGFAWSDKCLCSYLHYRSYSHIYFRIPFEWNYWICLWFTVLCSSFKKSFLHSVRKRSWLSREYFTLISVNCHDIFENEVVVCFSTVLNWE